MNNDSKDNRVTVFHVDTVERNNEFINGGFLPSEEDGDWLGKGMYFWDNKSNANYWLKQRTKNNPETRFNISRATLIFNDSELFDMTDFETRKNIPQFLKNHNVPLNKEILKQTGLVINLIYTENDELNDDNFKLIKGAGMYGTYKGDLPSFLNYRKNSPHITGQVKIIYAVRDEEIIINRVIL